MRYTTNQSLKSDPTKTGLILIRNHLPLDHEARCIPRLWTVRQLQILLITCSGQLTRGGTPVFGTRWGLTTPRSKIPSCWKLTHEAPDLGGGFLNTVTNFRFPYKFGNLITDERILASQNELCCMELFR